MIELRRTTLLAALVLAVRLFGSAAHGAQVQPLFNIAAGPLQAALERLAEQTGLQLLYDPVLLDGVVTRGVKGAMPPKKALAALLGDTDIAFNFTADDAVALFRKSTPAPVPTVNSSDRPHTVTISTNRTIADLYNSNMSMTATKVDESFLNVPLASESLSQGVLRDLQVNRLEDALQYVSGAEVAPNGQSALGFELRGFPTYQYYLDGVRVSPDLHHDAYRDLANVEQIDVVKGPASLLYGRTEPGGAINVITKQPLSERYLSLEQQGGSFGYQRTEIDAGGPLSAGHGLLYRFNAAYENQHSFRDTSGNHRIFLAPVMTWNSSNATSTTFYAEYLNSHDVHDSGLPVIGSQLPPVPIERSLEAGGDIHTRDYRFGVKGSHVFADGWTLRHHLDFRWVQSPQTPQAAISDDGLDPPCATAGCAVNRELVSIPESRGHTFFVSADALRDFSLWRVRNSVLVGTDLFASSANTRFLFRSDSNLQVDLFHPHGRPVNWSLLESPDSGSLSTTAEEWVGAYVQDQVQIGNTVHLLFGGRFDRVHERVERNGTIQYQSGPSPVQVGQSDKIQAVKYRAGILWHPLRPISVYANFSQNFGVTAGLFEGAGNTQLLLPAEESQEWETGVKLESPRGRISATVALFDLTKKNISTPILSPALDNASVGLIINGARNDGLEVDFRGEIVPGLQLLASYAYIHSRIDNFLGQWTGIVPKNAELIGNTPNWLFGVPEHGGSVWASYDLDGDAWRGLKFGLGAVIRGVREGDNLNDYHLPTYIKVAGLAAYNWRAANTNFEFQLNVDNLLNERYFESLSGTRTVMPGEPRRFIATLRASF